MSSTIKLNGENWPVWKFQTGIILKGRGYYSIVDGTRQKPTAAGDDLTKWIKDDCKAQEVIVLRMEQGPLTHLLSCETSRDMWLKLKTVYDKESTVSVHLLQQRFFLLEFDGSVSRLLSQIEEIKTKLKTAGETLSDKMIITKILMALPDKFRHFRSAWESVDVNKQTLEELTSRLLLEEERYKSEENSTALSMQSKNRNQSRQRCHICSKVGHLARNCYFRNSNKNKNKENTENKNKKFCSYCKKSGHNVENCWIKKGKEGINSKQQEQSESSDTNAFMVYTEKLKTGDWCLDSGASEHMCWDKGLFNKINQLKIKKVVQVGNGHKLEVKGIGEVIVWAYNGKKLIKTTLSDVLYVPDLKFNLFSAGCALDKGYCMLSDQEKCQFVDKNGNVRALATRVNKLYRMHFTLKETDYNPITCFAKDFEWDFDLPKNSCEEIVDPIYACLNVKTIESIKDWHNKLAHQNLKYVRDFLKRNNIEYTECEKDFICESCLAGKQHRLSFMKSKSRATAPLGLVHADLCGPMENMSLGGSRYFLLFKDDLSAYRCVYFLNQKSQVKNCIEKFINLAERQTGQKMMILRTDNGLEFINKEVKEILENRGIRHQRTVVYTPEQNGRAERENRTLVEAARTLLYSSKNLDKSFWAEALNTVVYILNRTGPSPQKEQSPYELWHKKSVNINFLRVFGSLVSVYVPKETRLKWDPKNKQGIFLGYGEDIKGYRVYIPQKNKVETHRDVIFLPEKNKITKQIEEKVIIPEENFEIHDDDINETQSNGNLENSSETSEIDEFYSDASVHEDENDSDINDELVNNRYELRRERKRNTRYDDYELDLDRVLVSVSDEDVEVMCYDDAMASSECKNWKEAIKSEIKALEENDTWFLVSEKEIKSEVIESKWVFRKKKDETGNVATYKARLVARGFQQTGMNNSDIYIALLPSYHQ